MIICKSQILLRTTHTVFNDLKFRISKKKPIQGKKRILSRDSFFKRKISGKSTVLVSQKTMNIKNKSHYVINVDGAGLKIRISIFWLKICKYVKKCKNYLKQYKRYLQKQVGLWFCLIQFKMVWQSPSSHKKGVGAWVV